MEYTVIIPFYNGHDHLDQLVMSLSRLQPILIVDDHSDTPLDPDLTNKKYRNVQVIRPKEKGYFAGAVNAGIQALQAAGRAGDYLILNQDVYFTSNEWQDELAKIARTPRVAIIGDGVASHPAWPGGYVQGTLMWLRREAVDAVGLFNQADYPLWGCTAEWQLRACRRGWFARPIRNIPGFIHKRPKSENFGSSIKAFLEQNGDLWPLMVRTPPMLSVIIPCYNQGRYLPDAIASLIGGPSTMGDQPGQTFQSFEIIMVDDASGDDSVELAKLLVDPWQGIKLIQRDTNGGTSAAINDGIKAAYGRYITILDADDLRTPDSLEKMLRLAEENPHAVIYDDVIFHFETPPSDAMDSQAAQEAEVYRVVGWEGPGVRYVRKLADYDFDKLLERNLFHAGILFPKQAWEDIGGYPEMMREGREDWAVNLAFGRKGYCGIHLKEPGYIYRRHSANRTLTNTGLEHRAMFASQIRALYPDLYQGVRPMGCCGNQQNTPDLLAGTSLLTYQGGNVGSETYYGPVTGKNYPVSAIHPTISVDKRDEQGLLALWEGGGPVFLVAAPEPVLSAPITSATVTLTATTTTKRASRKS